MSSPSPTEDGCSGRGFRGYSGDQRLNAGSGYVNNGGQGYIRSSSRYRLNSRGESYGGGSFDPNNGEGTRHTIGTYATFGMGSGGRGGGCCSNQAKSSNTGGVADVKSGGCASPEGCRCVNLDDPQKVFKLVLQAIRHINDGEGATPVEIHCYMRKHHRMPDDEDKLMQIVKDSLKRGICIGCLRRRYCDGKYYISQKSSGRCKRKPVACVNKDTLPVKSISKKPTGGSKKKKKNNLKVRPKKKCGHSKAKPKGKAKRTVCKKPKTKKKVSKNKPKTKCPPKKIKRKGLPAKSKGRSKSKGAKSKPKTQKPPAETPSDGPKKTKCTLFPSIIWPNFEMKAVNKVDQIWDNIPPLKW